MLIDKSDGSAAARETTDSIEKTVELIADLIRKLLAGKEDRQQEQADPGQDQNTKTIDELCAEATMDLLSQHGQPGMDENGSPCTVYEAEGYKVSANLNDPTGMPVYTISTDNRGDIFSFQKDPTGDGFVFFETQSQLNDFEKVQLLNSLKSSLEKELHPQPDKKGIEKVAQDAKNQGDFAPKGSKAIVLSGAVLQSQGKTSYQGKNYSAKADKKGTITLLRGGANSQTTQEILKMEPDGRIQNRGMTVADSAHFLGAYTQASKAAHQSGATKSKPLANAKPVEKVGR